MFDTELSPWPCFTEEEAFAVSRVLISNRVNYWTGQETREFEKEFAEWVGTTYAVALANGTVALDIALVALGVGKGDEVIVTCRTFIASVSCIITAGATPVFADVDIDSQNITAKTIEAVISPRTKAIICVHLAGWPCEMDPIMELAKHHNLYVVEDCAQAHGAKYKGRNVGSIGHIAAWSFCQDKIMTTGGEGGMVTTNDHALWERMWSYKDHGKSWSRVHAGEHNSEFRWLHHSFGTNWRMMEIQAVIGRIQLKRMSEWHEKRLKNAHRIWDMARLLPLLRVPELPDNIQHAGYKCYVFINPKYLAKGWDRARIIKTINQMGVPCFLGSCPEVYLEKAFENTPWQPRTRLPTAQCLGETSLMFLIHPTLSSNEINKTCEVLRDVSISASAKIEGCQNNCKELSFSF